MNRRLHNASLAASASGVMLLCTLLLAVSSQTGTFAQPGASAAVEPAAAPVMASAASRMEARQQALEARIEAKARAFEARMARSADTASVGDTIASAMSFAADVTTEATLMSAFGALADQDALDDAGIEVEAAQRRHARRARGALAVPYFSFAQGLRSSGS